MGIMGWLLVWLIVNALFVVWRILVKRNAESRNRLVRQYQKLLISECKTGPESLETGAVNFTFGKGLGAEIPDARVSLRLLVDL